jgi:hypothetical protein
MIATPDAGLCKDNELTFGVTSNFCAHHLHIIVVVGEMLPSEI